MLVQVMTRETPQCCRKASAGRHNERLFERTLERGAMRRRPISEVPFIHASFFLFSGNVRVCPWSIYVPDVSSHHFRTFRMLKNTREWSDSFFPMENDLR